MTSKNIRLDRRKGLYLGDAGVKGRGVFCTSDIAPGSLLEVAPSLVLNEAATRSIDKTALSNYTFMAGKVPKRVRDRLRIKKTEDCSSLIMGVATFCNHGVRPNAVVLWEEDEGTVYHTLQATRRIPKNTEICTAYGRGWFKGRG